MPTPHELNLIANGAVLALNVLLIWLMWRDHRHAYPARVAIAMCVLTTPRLLLYTPEFAAAHPLLSNVLDIATNSAIGLFWLFARLWFRDEKRVGWQSWLIALFPTAVDIALLAMKVPMQSAPAGIWNAIRTAIWLVLALSAVWFVVGRHQDDLIEERRVLRFAMTINGCWQIALAGFIELAIAGMNAPQDLRVLSPFSVLIGDLYLVCTMLMFRRVDLFGSVERERKPRGEDDAQAEQLAQQLQRYMDAEKPWRDENLTIALLANKLNVQERRLRALINGALGYRNFSQFLNSYRLDEVKNALKDPDQREVQILVIALDAGFGSLVSFNRAFRDAEGMTPSEFRRRTI